VPVKLIVSKTDLNLSIGNPPLTEILFHTNPNAKSVNLNECNDLIPALKSFS
jgi:hypothetical protein